MSRIEDRVCKKIQERAEFGLRKYGVSLERTDLSTKQWLTHLQEELMDACGYIERLLEIMKFFENLENPDAAKSTERTETSETDKG